MKDLTELEIQDLCKRQMEMVFYWSGTWKKKRAEVLEFDHYECQLCKTKGIYTKATTVHHVKHLKDRPDLALSIFDGKERQLVSLCDSCHNSVHPEKLRKCVESEPMTVERW